jgi:hypothetical protein
MSYIIPPTRTYDHTEQNGRIHVPNYPSPSSSTPVQLPKVGQIRCCASLISFSTHYDRSSIVNTTPLFSDHLLTGPVDWSLLSSDLDFIYLDPVLQSHLEEQSESLVGKSLLSFVHPDEQASAKQDLGNVLESRTLHGSVTRYVISHSHSPLITPTIHLASVFLVYPQFAVSSAIMVHLLHSLTPKR